MSEKQNGRSSANRTKELWRPVPPGGDFEVSNHGRIRSCVDGRIKVPSRSLLGHDVVNLYANGISNVRNVHSLVAEAFLGPYPDAHVVVHIDGDERNSSACNLKYVHRRELLVDGEKGTATPTGRSNGGKLTRALAEQIRRRALSGEPTSRLATQYGVSAPTVSAIKHFRKWK